MVRRRRRARGKTTSKPNIRDPFFNVGGVKADVAVGEGQKNASARDGDEVVQVYLPVSGAEGGALRELRIRGGGDGGG